MTPRAHASRERLYRYMSIALAVVTALMLVPASWIPIQLEREKPKEPVPRPVEIVRLPPDTLPPPPPLPPKPKPKPEPEPEKPKPQLEPEPLLEQVRFEEVVPEIEIPRERVERREVALQADNQKTLRFEEQVPELDVPKEQRAERQRVAVEVEAAPTPNRREMDVAVKVPKAVPRQANQQRIEVAAATSESFFDAEAPDVSVVTPRAATRASDTPSPLPSSQQLKTGVAVNMAADAPSVDVPRGNTSRPNKSAPVAVSGAFSGTRVTYDANPGDANELAVASPKKSSGGGAAPKIAVSEGGASGLQYSSAPQGTPAGALTGGRRTGGTSSRLEAVRARLASKYGLPLVAVDDMGQRSTEAARWNMLLPQISDLFRESRGRGRYRGAPGDPVASIERDGESVIIRYRDGITHVIVPAGNGLAALFVARGEGARPVVSKVEEADSARKALHRYIRGASS